MAPGSPPPGRARLFASTLRSWQATRPLRMRRCRAEATHDGPHIEDLLDEADWHLAVLGGLTVADLDDARPDQIAALHGLCSTFLRLPQAGAATCVGITKAVLLVSVGRIGPAFDSTVRNQLGLKRHLKSSDEWVEVLRLVGRDIRRFEQRHGDFRRVVPGQFTHYEVGRLYDMLLGPGVPRASPAEDDPPSVVAGPDKVNFNEKLALSHDHWNPRIVGQLNGQHVKLVKLLGEFVWHKHDH